MLLELQNTVLKMIARGDSLQATMDRLCGQVEALAPGVVCSVLAKDKDGFMHPLAGPSLPEDYNAAIDGIAAGPNVGSCGASAFLGVPVAVIDIATDPRWVDFKHLPLPLGFSPAGPARSSTRKGVSSAPLHYISRSGAVRRTSNRLSLKRVFPHARSRWSFTSGCWSRNGNRKPTL